MSAFKNGSVVCANVGVGIEITDSMIGVVEERFSLIKFVRIKTLGGFYENVSEKHICPCYYFNKLNVLLCKHNHTFYVGDIKYVV